MYEDCNKCHYKGKVLFGESNRKNMLPYEFATYDSVEL